MVSLVYLPLSFSPALMQWLPALLIGLVAVSAMLSGWLGQRPRIQKYVTAVALAAILAMSIYSAAHPKAATVKTSPLIDCDLFWFAPECWLR